MRMLWLMTVSRWRAARPVVVLVAAMAAVLSAWFVHAWPMGGHATAQQLQQWGLQVHQQLRSSGQRVNAAVVQSATKQRVLAGDDAITAAVSDALVATQSDDLRMLQVDTSHAMVTLSGTVTSTDLRQRAVAIAQSTSGVHGVFSLIRVVPVAVG